MAPPINVLARIYYSYNPIPLLDPSLGAPAVFAFHENWWGAYVQDQIKLPYDLFGFAILGFLGLTRFDDSRLCDYYVRADRVFPDDKIVTVLFDGDTGAFRAAMGATSPYTGNTITNWLRALHLIVDPVDYLAYRIFVVVIGLVVVMLSITGVCLWWTKDSARRFRARRTLGPDSDDSCIDR